MNITSKLDKLITAGGFRYTNKSGKPQRIGAIVVTVSDPGTLSSLTATLRSTGQTATVSPVASTNMLTFDPPIPVGDGQSLRFSLTATTGLSAAAMLGRGVAYASMLAGGGSIPLGPMSGGLVMLGVILMPLGFRRRRRTAWMAFAALLLIATMAGCSDGGSGRLGITREVETSGVLNSPAKLSVIQVRTGNSNPTSKQFLTAFVFKK